MKDENKALRRVRNTKNASFLTHGADDYDHKGLNNARRVYGKAVIRTFSEESSISCEEIAIVASVVATLRIVLTTQVYENYATHCCKCESEESCTCGDYWKAKGGGEYHIDIGSAADVIALGSEGIQAIVDKMSLSVSKDTRDFREQAIGWSLIPSNEETHDEQMYREMRDEGLQHIESLYQTQIANLKLSP